MIGEYCKGAGVSRRNRNEIIIPGVRQLLLPPAGQTITHIELLIYFSKNILQFAYIWKKFEMLFWKFEFSDHFEKCVLLPILSVKLQFILFFLDFLSFGMTKESKKYEFYSNSKEPLPGVI